ncbi:CLUMA_CG001759, isoform A [Clunio marinus]|uniref:CLUMA_CG001759, isoform A n=1 Tax=Clunio marinus TaxID=568069 RepID=A0A1J1HIY5_9DIPT|nr:CLUMA_CG001759, isoform A [Clunio marinus]
MAEGKIIKEVRDERQLDAWESLYIENGTELTNIDDPPIKRKRQENRITKGIQRISLSFSRSKHQPRECLPVKKGHVGM